MNSAAPNTDGANSRPRSRLTAIVILLVLGAVAVAAGALLFDHPTRLVSADYLYGNDIGPYQGTGDIALGIWKAGRGFFGYDPYFMAGFPWARYTSSTSWGLVFILLSGLKTGVRAAIFMLGTLFAIPFFYYFASKSHRTEEKWRLATAAFGVAVFFLGPAIFFWWMGQVEGCLSILFAVAAYSFFLDWIDSKDGGLKSWAIFVACSAFALLTHSMSAMFVFILILIALPIFKPDRKKWLMLCAGGFIALAMNSFWIFSGIEYGGYYDRDVGAIWSGPASGGFVADLFSFVGPAGSLFVVWFLIIASVVGIKSMAVDNRLRARAMAIGVIALTAIAYAGEFFKPIAAMQPRRFLVYVLSLLVFPAIAGAKVLWDKHPPKRRLVAAGVLIALALLTKGAYFRVLPFKLMTEVPRQLQEAAMAVKTETPPESRALVEDADDINEEAFKGGYFPPALQMMSGRELASHWLTRYKIRHNGSMFHDGTIGGKNIESMTDEALGAYFDLYNIGSALCFTPQSKKRFDSSPALLEKKHDFGKLSFYVVKREPSYVIGGSANVKAGYNRIEVSGLKKSDRDVVLKYHCDRRLVADLPIKLECAIIGDDPIGFIKVVNAPDNFSIYFDY